MKAAAALSLLSLITLQAAPGRAQEQRPPEVAPDRYFAPGAPPVVDETGDAEEQHPPRVMEGDLDYDVTYDDAVAQSYDDGYDPQAAAQFADTLAPYGDWVDDDTYGRVWQPSTEVVGDDFSPYDTGGRWAYTEYGWTWVSEWDWGWAPFHYGRWLAIAQRGWCWMPGTLWGPAWVSWRAGGGYVAWAPLAPRRVSIGSPLGVGSSWRFALSADLARGRGFMQPQQVAPRVFGRMTVVSNPRALPIPGAKVRVNAGPTFVGMPPAATASSSTRLVVVAPRALPRRVIEPHPGTPAANLPWVRAAGRSYESFDGQRAGGGTGDPRPGVGATPRLQRGPIPPRTFPSGVAPGNRRAPTIHGAPSAMISRVGPGYRGPTTHAPPMMAPRPGAAAPSRFVAPSYAPRPSFGGGRSFSSGYSSGGGGRSSTVGSFGGRPSFSGGRTSTGSGGHSSFGGGRRR
jgi:hypothetical protein